ncbi:MAG: prolipoprotein diacylglyceryl transferase [Saprospiraceae bacterium]|nr:prolipoprotein diacylglyceryl transferase [Saprospiraceae bacterium]MCB9342961.1 prolipoprotein diacylglyceryl transferase [Lewinellaceae bacterium]
MYPDLSYLFHDLFGTAPDNALSMLKTFGFFLAIAFIVSAIVFNYELKRKARAGIYTPAMKTMTIGLPASNGELISNAIVGFILGGKGLYAFHHFDTFRHDPASVILSSKMDWLGAILGAVMLTAITYFDGQRRKLEKPETKEVPVYPHDRISEMTVIAAVSGILGAKIFDLFDNWDSFLQDPIGSLASGGGLAFLGGLVFGFIGVVYYIWKNNIPFFPTADAAAMAVTAGYGVGRIGCQLAGDGDWGIVNSAPKPGWMSFLPDWMWAYRFPHNVLNTEFTDPVGSVPIEGCTWDYNMQLSEPVYPTPFYEIMMMALIFGLLWALRKRLRIQGMLFFVYLGVIAIERFLIEKIRVNVVHDIMGMKMTQAEIISVILFLISVTGCVYLWRKDKMQSEAVELEPEPAPES